MHLDQGPRIGPYGLLSVQADKTKYLKIQSLAATFACEIRRGTEDHRLEIVTQEIEAGAHKEQVLRLFALGIVLVHFRAVSSMNLQTPRFTEDYATDLSFARLALSADSLYILRQAGLAVRGQLSFQDLSGIIEIEVNSVRKKYA